jgi:hypothetical protein
MVLAATAAAAVTGDGRPLILAFFIVIAATICTAFVASVIAAALGFESLNVFHSFSSSDFVGLKNVDGLGELPGPPWAAAEFLQDAP